MGKWTNTECSFTVCTHSFWTKFCLSFFFSLSHPLCYSPSFHQNTSHKCLTLYFSTMHAWRHPGRAKKLCMVWILIPKYATLNQQFLLFQFSAKFPKFEETSDTSIDLNVVNDEMKLRNLENMYKKHGKLNYGQLNYLSTASQLLPYFKGPPIILITHFPPCEGR